MKCPKCSADFESVKFENVYVNRCTNCRGLWFDMLEKEDLEKMEGSESIDIGEKQVGEWQDHIRKIKCPKCNDTMINMVDKEQFHIHYELCPVCYGTFFDAGEFRDLKENTIIERFREMLDSLRANFR